MIARCTDPRLRSYQYYGARGIKVCDRWADPDTGFDAFMDDMGQCPDGMSLDREESDGNYCPENCRWVPDEIQRRNKRNNNWQTVFAGTSRERTQCMSDWAKETGIPRRTIRERLKRGLTPEQALGFEPDSV